MASYILIFLALGLAIGSNRIIESKNVSKEAACYIPDGCVWYKPNRKTLDRHLYCNNLYARIDYQKLKESSYSFCMPDSPEAKGLAIHFNRDDYNRRRLLNNSFELLKIEPYIKKMSSFYYYLFKPRFFFHNLRGFHASLRLPMDHRGVGFIMYDSDLNFFSSENSLIRTCEAYRKASGSEPRNVFWNVTLNTSKSLFTDVFFDKCRFPTPICPLVFQNAKLFQITIYYMTRFV